MDGRPGSAAAAAAIISYRSTRETDDFKNSIRGHGMHLCLSSSFTSRESESVRAAALSNKHTRRFLGGN